MNGAREFSQLFKTAQYGRLFIVSGNHARGSKFRIYVLPKDELAIENGANNPCLNSDAIEVYGVVAGNPGWTESYGWLRRGPWCDDFYELVLRRRKEIGLAQQDLNERKRAFDKAIQQKEISLLSNY